MSEHKGFFDSMTKSQSFTFGIVGGVLVLCAIGFFIMLGLFMNGSCATASSSLPAILDDAGPEKFSQCLDSGKFAADVRADMSLGSSLGVNGTPGSFINGYQLSGALPYDMVKQVIDSLLSNGTPDFDFMKDRETGEIVKIDVPELPGVVWRGDKNAPITIVEFSDFECPYCSNFASTIEQIMADYEGKVKFTYRHFPLSFHANAQKAAEAFECAKEQKKPFEMHDKLFELAKTNQLSVANFKKAAGELKLK